MAQKKKRAGKRAAKPARAAFVPMTERLGLHPNTRMQPGGDLYRRPRTRAEMDAPLAWHEKQLAVPRRYGDLGGGVLGSKIVGGNACAMCEAIESSGSNEPCTLCSPRTARSRHQVVVDVRPEMFQGEQAFAVYVDDHLWSRYSNRQTADSVARARRAENVPAQLPPRRGVGH